MKITKQQKFASEKLFIINPADDKCLRLTDKGQLEFVPDETEYSEGLGRAIVELVYEGASILEIVQICDVSVDRIVEWRTPAHPDYEEAFQKGYDIADQASADQDEAESLAYALDRSDDLYSDVNKDGIETLRPNSANVQRSRLITESMDQIAGIKDPNKHGNNPEDTGTDLDLEFIIQMVPTEPPIVITAEKATEIEAPGKETTCQ